jgi:hypothetical protein
MWAFFSARFRMWLILAVAAPLLGWLLGRIGDLIEARRGANTVSRLLKTGRDFLGRRSRGPLAPRPTAERTGGRDAGLPTR